MNENNEVQYAVDAATIYSTTLQPLLNKIRHLKYNENTVFHDDDSKSCKLIQNKNSIDDLLVSSSENKVVSFNVGLVVQKPNKKKQGFIIESDESQSGGLAFNDYEDYEDEDDEESNAVGSKFLIKIKDPNVVNNTTNIIEDEPIIGQGKDGVEWTREEYQMLWNKLPDRLKTEFKLNLDWMKDFMFKCVNDQKEEHTDTNNCRLSTPPNIIIPPRQISDNQYDFGVPIYNRVFNKQAKSLQDTYLTFFKEDSDTKEKDYKLFEDAINSLIEKEVDPNSVFF